jgi:hypothetical protein
MLTLNCKHVQLVKIYITCLGVIALFSSFFSSPGHYSKMGTQIYLKIAGYVDLDMLNMFAV